jgi:hypothetical protein
MRRKLSDPTGTSPAQALFRSDWPSRRADAKASVAARAVPYAKEIHTMRRLMRPLAAAAVAAVGLMAVPAAQAQVQTAPGTTAAPMNIPDHKLDAAAAAIGRVAKLSQDYQEQIAAAPPPEKERLAKEANSAMVKAVNDQGLSVDEYNTIVDTAQKDPKVHEKIMQRLQPAPK